MPHVEISKPKNFINLSERIGTIETDVKYYSTDNFVGEHIDGYNAPVIYVTEPAAEALDKGQQKLLQQGMGFRIFDGYRPMRASRHFFHWRDQPETNSTKAAFYPHYTKREIFEKGFVALYSDHSKGSTVDLTIIDLQRGTPLDMGSPFDYFGEASRYDCPDLTTRQIQNRMMLKYLMLSIGFLPYATEWWHFTLAGEPYPRTYFDFVIE